MKSLTFLLILLSSVPLLSREYHVSGDGSDRNPGTRDSPFLTIQAAADVAVAGDTITVHEGIYRERVDPKNGGSHDLLRILYRAAENEKVVLKGSEVVADWVEVEKGVWKSEVQNRLFGDYNPYLDTVHGDWFNPRGRRHHTGEVFLNGKALFEQNSLEGVQRPEIHEEAVYPESSLLTWYCQANEVTTTFWANFGDRDPNEEEVEISVRPACFYPSRPGINFITVRGFDMSMAATQWAAPTAEQPGLIGTHWSKGWIIEENVISNSKSVGISLGKDRVTGHNVWANNRSKDGATAYNEVIFNALESGWSQEKIGSHLVRNNEIFDCGQAGIVGSMGAVFSTISGNHIHDIYTKRTYAGAEMAGIKIHAAIDVLIESNLIHGSFIGIWLDWMAQGARVRANILFDNSQHDFFSEVNHGPCLVDHNLFLTTEGLSIQDASEGSAFVHNLFAGRIRNFNVAMRSTPYHREHSTRMMGVRNIRGGDNRFINNIFIRSGVEEDQSFTDRTHQRIRTGYGLAGYDDSHYASISRGNLYYHGAKPYTHGQNYLEVPGFMPEWEIEERDGGVYLILKIDQSPGSVDTELVTTKVLGSAVVPEAIFEQADGKPYRLDLDFLGMERNPEQPLPGPFESLVQGENVILLWAKRISP